MNNIYECFKCKDSHDLNSKIGQEHLKHVLSKNDFGVALDFTCSAGAYAYITNNTQQYVRDTQVFGVLADKFNNSGIFSGRESSFNWITERKAVNPDNVDQILRRLQGDGAGEVDALRQINGSLKGLFYKTDFIRDASGHIPSNTAGIDLQVVNRFTGEVVEQIQVKSNWSSNPNVLRQTIHDFLNNAEYNETITLAGPKELIEEAQKLGIKNPLTIVNDVDGNRLSGERLQGLIEKNDIAVEGHLTFMGVAERVAGGAAIGAVVGASLSAIGNFIAYRQGRITGPEAFIQIGIDASRSAIIGGTIGGLSVLFPPGAVGIGIGIAVGTAVRRIVDLAYGKGAYEDIVNSMNAVEYSVKLTADGIAVIGSSTIFGRQAQKSTLDNIYESSLIAKDTEIKLNRLKQSQLQGKR